MTLKRIVAVMMAVAVVGAGHAEEPIVNLQFEKLANEKGPALVTVKFVLKVSTGGMMGDDEESETEITGVMVDTKGIVLCSNAQLGGFVGVMKKMLGPMGTQITLTPTDLKVLIGDDSEGQEAELVARDTELDLAWVRLKKEPEQPMAAIDFEQSAKAVVGEQVLSINRLGKYYGRAVVVSEGRIGGRLSKPRELLTGAGTTGTPVFSMQGRVIGMAVMQMPEGEEAENPIAILGRLSRMQELFSSFVLPADTVVKATKRALAGETKAESKEPR